jgi:hypothetical protein
MRRSWALLAAAFVMAGRPAEAVFPGRHGLVAVTDLDHLHTGCHGLAVWAAQFTFIFGFGCTAGEHYGDPEWSPDGSRLAFSYNGFIERVNADGLGRVRLTSGSQPAWSSSGGDIVFTRAGDLWRIRADGTGEARLTDDPGQESDPEWSPDGARIAFISTQDGNPEVYTMRASGTDWRRVTNDPATEAAPQWSPDGTRLLFHRGNNTFLVNPDGSGLLTTGIFGEGSWSPDGRRLVFLSAWNGFPAAIVSALPDGSDRQLFVQYPPRTLIPESPRWQPRPAVGAASIRVDPLPGPQSNGDGRLSPGETAAVMPAWHNLDSAPLALAGRALSFEPLQPRPGWTFDLLDDDATYGTLPPGASLGCMPTDCYVVRVGGPGVPTAHTDTVLVERVTENGAVARMQRWRIHVFQGFLDLPPASPFAPFAEALVHRFDAAGCAPGRFCPAAPVTRAETARLLLGALDGSEIDPAACQGHFADVPAGHPLCAVVEAFWLRGLSAGCGPGVFCPDALVTRGELTVLALAAAGGPAPPPCVEAPFIDVSASHPFCPFIRALAERGVVAGCGSSRFCPQSPVTRQELSVVVAHALGLTLAGPE